MAPDYELVQARTVLVLVRVCVSVVTIDEERNEVDDVMKVTIHQLEA